MTAHLFLWDVEVISFEYNKTVFPDFPENPFSTKFANPSDFVWLWGLLVSILWALQEKRRLRRCNWPRPLLRFKGVPCEKGGDFCEGSSALSFSLSCRSYHIPGGHRFQTDVFVLHVSLWMPWFQNFKLIWLFKTVTLVMTGLSKYLLIINVIDNNIAIVLQ